MSPSTRFFGRITTLRRHLHATLAANMSSTLDLPSQCCADLPRLEIPGEYTLKGTHKKTPNLGMAYYEVAANIQRTDLAVIQIYDVSGRCVRGWKGRKTYSF